MIGTSAGAAVLVPWAAVAVLAGIARAAAMVYDGEEVEPGSAPPATEVPERRP